MAFSRELRRATVVAASVAAVAPAMAQRLAFNAKSYVASPGESVALKILVSECSQPVSGVRFAVRLRKEDTGGFLLDKATAFTGESFQAFVCAQNIIAERESAGGYHRGAVAEVRGAIYSTEIDTPRVLSRSEKHAATVMLPVGPQATGRYVVELAADDDDRGEPLSAIFDPQGHSIAPPNRKGPEGAIASIVIQDGRTEMSTAFGAGGTGWIFESTAPAGGEAVAAGIETPERGLTIAADAAEAMGAWRFDVDRLGAWRTPPAGSLYVASPLVATTGDPWIGARVGSTETIVRAVGGAGFPMPTIIAEPTAEGADVRFAVLPSASGADERRTASMASLSEKFEAVDALTKKRTDYLRVFSVGQKGKWVPAAGDEFKAFRAQHPNTPSGIGVMLGGAAGGFAMGSWTTPAGVTGIVADGNRRYRLDADVVVPEGAGIPRAVRLRVHAPDQLWTTMTTIRPTAAGPTKGNFWFVPPAELAGTELFLSFDVLGNAAEEGAPAPAAFLKQVRVESWQTGG